jgi:T4 RnlA family RNA ligase
MKNKIPTYEEALELCSYDNSPFYETKIIVQNYNISIFNYRLAQYNDFVNPIPNKPYLKGYEMRGLTFVFNNDGSIFKRYILLEKFFNINQVEESLYSVVKNYKIKYINNKEDGSIATFIKLPNGEIIGKSKLGFDNMQANAINDIYKNNSYIKTFVNWSLDNDIIPIFEYVGPNNKIVLQYYNEELILTRLRKNSTGEYLNINEYLDKIDNIKIAVYENNDKSWEELIEFISNQTNKEGSVITAEDNNGNIRLYKIKTLEYLSLHGLLTEDLYKENMIISYILDDTIDDILSKIPQTEIDALNRINKIIYIVKKEINDKVIDIEISYNNFIKSGLSRKDYAISNRKSNPNFSFIMNLLNAEDLKKLSEEEILEIYGTFDKYEKRLNKLTIYEMVKEVIRSNTNKLQIAREWLKEKDPKLQFNED